MPRYQVTTTASVRLVVELEAANAEEASINCTKLWTEAMFHDSLDITDEEVTEVS